MKKENPFREFSSGEAGEIARKLIVSVSNAVAEAAAAASKNLGSPKTRSEVLDLENQILSSLDVRPISLVTLRKKIAEANSGRTPDQVEFERTLEGLVASKLISKTISKDRELFALTEEGQSRATIADSVDMAGEEGAENHESFSVMKSAGRISTLLFEVASNGTERQKALVTEELESMRSRILAILADDKLG